MTESVRRFDLTGRCVLVVDGHEDTMDLHGFILEQAGAVVCRAAGLLDALGYFDQEKVAVVVTELEMPHGPGLALLSELHMRRYVPVLAVTGQLAPGGPSLIDAGFAAVLFKPVDPGELVQVVWHLAQDGHGEDGHAPRSNGDAAH